MSLTELWGRKETLERRPVKESVVVGVDEKLGVQGSGWEGCGGRGYWGIRSNNRVKNKQKT